MASPGLWACAASAAAWAAAIGLLVLQLNNRLAWSTWWIPVVLAFAAPLGLLVGFWWVGATLRGWAVLAGAYAILFGFGAVAMSAAATTESGGEVIGAPCRGLDAAGTYRSVW